MLINPQEFLLKEIPDLHPLSLDYVQFWREMNKRCIEGYWLGGYYMPSGLYFYTHLGTIQLNADDSNTKRLGRPNLRDIELSFFPNFLICRGFSGFDLDEEYSSHSILLNPDITDEYLLRRHPTTMSSSGVRKEYLTPLTNLTMQHPYHKGRAIYKNEAQNFMMMGARNFGKSFLVGVGVISHQWITDGLTEYAAKREPILITVGAELAHYSNLLLQKTKLSIENMPGKKIINKKIYNSPLSKQYSGSWGPGKNIIAEYDKKYSGGWDKDGTLSTIAHRTFRDNSFADQGSRPAVLVLEEIGMFSNLKEVYTNTKDNLADGLRKTGTLMMLGTGGDMEKGTLDAADMFYNPEAYDILVFNDEWENRGKVAYFIPAYIALNEFKDERGYSDIEAAKAKLQKARDRAKTSSGGSEALNKEIQYRPWVPSEMFLSKSANVFPVTELRNRLSEVQTHNIYQLLEKKVDLFFDHKSEFNGVNYAMNLDATAVSKFPWNSDDIQGAVVLYELPYVQEGRVPPGAYIIGCDHFKENNNTGSSLAAIYVMKTSKYPSIIGYDEVVASYIGRPYMGASEVTETLYKLSLFYGNAKVYFENTAGAGDIKSYFERMKRLDLLASQPVTVFNKKASYDTNPSVIYGYPMSNDKIKWEAIKYVRNWLLNSREGTQDNPKRNLDLICDPYLLQQLISFNMQGNFDAVMGLVGCIIGLEEMHNLSVRRDTAELSEVESQFDKFLINNKYLFNEKLSNATVKLRW